MKLNRLSAALAAAGVLGTGAAYGLQSQPAPVAAAAATTDVSSARPSFEALVARQGPAVVNISVVGTRADGPPSYFTSFTLHYTVTGPVPDAAIQRAIDLSRDTYCSVWHSLRQGTPLEVSFSRVDG